MVAAPFLKTKTKMKLELKHSAPYLPYRLQGVFKLSDVIKLSSFQKDETRTCTLSKDNISFFVNYCKPRLMTLSCFYEEIDGLSLSDMTTHGYHNDFWHEDNFDVKHLNYYDFTRLAEKHCDLFGLIEKGLAIDINTL